MNETCDIAIVGGGAAGLMAAIAAAEGRTAKIAIIERMDRCGSKILISGGGRCNLSNRSLSANDYFGGSRNFIRNVLASFGTKDTIRFFESLGVEITEEDEGRLFPRKGAHHLLAALLGRVGELGVQLVTGFFVEHITFTNGIYKIHGRSKSLSASRVVLACGGSACPACGTDGSGFALAASLGHSIIAPTPALVPIELNEPDLRKLAGITIDAELVLRAGDVETANSRGSMLFTHGGISGPAALNISRHIARSEAANPTLLLNSLPGRTLETLSREIREWMRLHPKAEIITSFKKILPERFCTAVFRREGIDASKRLSNLSRDDIKNTASAFTELSLSVKGVGEFKSAHATAGGVALTEVRYQTMESRISRGLYLAGEVLDVDGMTGGYNFQWAWSTGFIAGRASSAVFKKKC